ncbi:hypothetical protein SAMN05216382_1526 [Sphingomonas palmae]|uniref:Uncharacterized protein n=1 Tax=Sphingomonas palmae TaxID=1855283 RepID=A0A1H7MK76_9SPHN|nr:hypothetical protein [Sphingomonas palmae]SEL11710.1 hypothetical protein SAMN05216382_1526 [Sphingomonas palmae]
MNSDNPMWKNSVTLRKQLDEWTDDNIASLASLYNVSLIFGGLLWSDDVNTLNEIADCISLTPYAEGVWQSCPIDVTASPYLAKLAFFQSFYHTDLFVDVIATDFKRIREIVDASIKGKIARSPSRFGRSLYDRYNSMFDMLRADHLSVSDTERLLNSTDQGVYQYGNDVLGPLGLLNSPETRNFRASRSLPLWHCDNVGCNHLHDVSLSDHQGQLRQVINQIDSYCDRVMGPPSHWSAAISMKSDEYIDDDYGDLFIIIQEQFSKEERIALLSELLDRPDPKELLWPIIKSSFKKTEYQKPRSDFLAAISSEHINHLILVNDNIDLIFSIDSLIKIDAIIVPSTEVRRARTNHSSLSSRCEISSLGIRSAGINPIIKTAQIVWEAYDENGSLSELSWRALKAAGPATPGTVLQYLNAKSPKEAISDLVLCSSEISQYIMNSLIIELYDDETNDALSDRILWKLGFDVPRYGREHSNLLRNLDLFRDVLIEQSGPLDEIAREKIRSSGVNLFVHLENFLENLISYNVWLFSNDHYNDSFIYKYRLALECVPKVIGPIGDTSWNPLGGNTLGVLLSYLSASLTWMEGLLKSDPLAIKRPDEDYPHYSHADDKLFPFHYTEFWGNSDKTELARYIDAYKDATNSFLRSGLAAVRNGIDHYRAPERFPTVESMLLCEMKLRQAVFSTDVKGIYPKTWWMNNRLYDSNGRYEETLFDQSGKITKLSYPTVLKGIREITFGEAAIIPHGNLIGQSNSSIVFVVREESHASKMWDNYPARKGPEPKFDPQESGDTAAAKSEK